MSFTNREFSWDLNHLHEFWETYVKAYVNKGYAFGGAKKVSDTITTSDRKMFYLLTEVGTYANMSSSIVHTSGIGIAIWNGSAWSYQNVPIEDTQGIHFTLSKNISWTTGAYGTTSLYISVPKTKLVGVKKIEYSGLKMGNSFCAVAFYDENGSYMQSISVRGTGAFASGTIDVENINASYVGFSTTLADLSKASIKLYDFSGIVSLVESVKGELETEISNNAQYSDGMAGVAYASTPTSGDAVVKSIIKNVWLEVIDQSATIPTNLRVTLFRNRSTGSGNQFIVQLADSNATSTVLFNGSNATKLGGVNYVKIPGLSSLSDKANIYMTLDFTSHSEDMNYGTSTLSIYFVAAQMNRSYATTETLKQAVTRLDEDVNSPTKYPIGDISGVGAIGASLMYSGNGWVEQGCTLCGVTSYNKAESGVGTPSYFADLMWRGTFCTDAEFEAMDILAIQFASAGDVYTGEFLTTSSDYTTNFDISDTSNQFASTYTNAQCVDYILKWWQEHCYAARNTATSKWYNTQYGKPCRLMFVTHWHDARVTYNDSIRQLYAKWGGGLCEFDKKIGFSKNQALTNGTQPSVIFAKDTEVISGVTYGWHPLRDTGGIYIQKKMANIFANSLLEYFGQN